MRAPAPIGTGRETGQRQMRILKTAFAPVAAASDVFTAKAAAGLDMPPRSGTMMAASGAAAPAACGRSMRLAMLAATAPDP